MFVRWCYLRSSGHSAVALNWSILFYFFNLFYSVSFILLCLHFDYHTLPYFHFYHLFFIWVLCVISAMSFHSYWIWNILTFLKVRKFQNENMESSYCPNFFVHILGNATTSYFHFEIYWPLPKGGLVSHKYSFFVLFFKKQSLAFSRKNGNPLGKQKNWESGGSKFLIVICIRGENQLENGMRACHRMLSCHAHLL